MDRSTYLKEIETAYQAEVRGEATFATLAECATSPDEVEIWRALARLEATTRARLIPLMERHGIDTTPDEEQRRRGRERLLRLGDAEHVARQHRLGVVGQRLAQRRELRVHQRPRDLRGERHALGVRARDVVDGAEEGGVDVRDRLPRPVTVRHFAARPRPSGFSVQVHSSSTTQYTTGVRAGGSGANDTVASRKPRAGSFPSRFRNRSPLLW